LPLHATVFVSVVAGKYELIVISLRRSAFDMFSLATTPVVHFSRITWKLTRIPVTHFHQIRQAAGLCGIRSFMKFPGAVTDLACTAIADSRRCLKMSAPDDKAPGGYHAMISSADPPNFRPSCPSPFGSVVRFHVHCLSTRVGTSFSTNSLRVPRHIVVRMPSRAGCLGHRRCRCQWKWRQSQARFLRDRCRVVREQVLVGTVRAYINGRTLPATYCCGT